MKPEQRGRWVAGLLLGAWLLVVAWQVDEHRRVVAAAQADLRHRSHEIARDLSTVARVLRFRGVTPQERLDPVLEELINNTNEPASTSQLLALGLLNTNGDTIVAVGNTNLISEETLGESEHWSGNHVTFIWPVSGATVSSEGVTNNPTVVLPIFPHNFTNGIPRGERDFQRHEPHPGEPEFRGDDHGPPPPDSPPPLMTNAAGQVMPGPPPDNGNRRPRRAPWMLGMPDAEYRVYASAHELHGLVLVMSAENYRATCEHDSLLRCIIAFFAAISAVGVVLAWRNTMRTSELQIRLVRASELNSHLKEMNLAAAGLAHETRNPLNIIRGLAQMVSRLPDASPEVRAQTKTIVDETDKVTAQLTEFINYSRPRELRRTRIALATAAAEVVRTLNFDIDEKKLKVETGGDPLSIEADEQLLRQVLFNLLLNAIQAVSEGGHIKIEVQRATATEAILEVCDDGMGVTPENRMEIFKPYFTTHQKGTGLGLAVVSQIVLAHGWEIQCLPNPPRGAIFRITHLKIAV